VARKIWSCQEFIYCANVWSSIGQKMLTHRRHFATIAVPTSLFEDLDGGCIGIWSSWIIFFVLIREYYCEINVFCFIQNFIGNCEKCLIFCHLWVLSHKDSCAGLWQNLLILLIVCCYENMKIYFIIIIAKQCLKYFLKTLEMSH